MRLVFLDAGAPRTAAIWRELEARAAPPYFLTWAWMENWLACLPPAATPRLAVILDGDEGPALAAGFLARRRVRRHHVVASDGWYLNATGDARLDDLCLEHNALLAAPGTRLTLAALLDLLDGAGAGWNELHLPAMARDRFPGSALGEPLPRHDVRIDGRAPSPYVDLARVRAGGGDDDAYLALLASGTRAQIRRARRGFGPLEVEVAAGEAQALDIYAELVRLHTARWRARGRPGAFADPWHDAFHRRLIRARIGHGEIQLLRVRARGATVGCLYNLVSSGRTLFYQSGLVMPRDPRLKPGLVTHAAAVVVNARAGHAVYDLLGGEARYKHSLATDETQLVWARVQRRLARFAIEETLRSWSRRWRAA